MVWTRKASLKGNKPVSAKDAEQLAANLTLRLYRQKNGIPVRFYPFSEFVKEYIEEYTLYKKTRTQLKDKAVLKTFIKMFLDIEYVKDFDDLILKQYISRRLSLGKEKATINRELGHSNTKVTEQVYYHSSNQ